MSGGNDLFCHKPCILLVLGSSYCLNSSVTLATNDLSSEINPCTRALLPVKCTDLVSNRYISPLISRACTDGVLDVNLKSSHFAIFSCSLLLKELVPMTLKLVCIIYYNNHNNHLFVNDFLE